MPFTIGFPIDGQELVNGRARSFTPPSSEELAETMVEDGRIAFANFPLWFAAQAFRKMWIKG
jgi:hypothetical protein